MAGCGTIRSGRAGAKLEVLRGKSSVEGAKADIAGLRGPLAPGVTEEFGVSTGDGDIGGGGESDNDKDMGGGGCGEEKVEDSCGGGFAEGNNTVAPLGPGPGLEVSASVDDLESTMRAPEVLSNHDVPGASEGRGSVTVGMLAVDANGSRSGLPRLLGANVRGVEVSGLKWPGLIANHTEVLALEGCLPKTYHNQWAGPDMDAREVGAKGAPAGCHVCLGVTVFRVAEAGAGTVTHNPEDLLHFCPDPRTGEADDSNMAAISRDPGAKAASAGPATGDSG